MIQRKKLIFCLLLLLPSPVFLSALEGQLGVRASLNAGYPSGKGLWDWTDPLDKGTLSWGPGWGAGVFGRLLFNENFLMESGINYVSIQAGQTVGAAKYTFSQQSLEIPVLFKTRPPFQRTFHLGGGPVFMFLPFKAERNGVSLRAEESFMLGLEASGDMLLYASPSSDVLLSCNFVHPVTSPVYKWEETSSGSIRINKVEFCVSWLFNLGREEE